MANRDAVQAIAREQAHHMLAPPQWQRRAEDHGQPEEAEDRGDPAGRAAEEAAEREADEREEGHHRAEPNHHPSARRVPKLVTGMPYAPSIACPTRNAPPS